MFQDCFSSFCGSGINAGSVEEKISLNEAQKALFEADNEVY
jgi:hypothetical protein